MVQLAGNRLPEATLAICQRKPTTGGTGVREFTEISDGTQEIRKFPAGTGYLRHKCQTQGRKDAKTNFRKSESAIVVMKRVMTVERRAGRQIERKRETMTVLSNDGQSWLTKLERIGEKSACDRSVVFNNLGHLIDQSMLKEQFRHLDGNKAVGIDRGTKACWGEQLDENISGLLQRLRRGRYCPSPARITEIPKEDGSSRPLAISCVEDR